MSFYEKYELLALLRDEGYKVFVAREHATARAVEAYLFVGGKSPLSETIIGKRRMALMVTASADSSNVAPA